MIDRRILDLEADKMVDLLLHWQKRGESEANIRDAFKDRFARGVQVQLAEVKTALSTMPTNLYTGDGLRYEGLDAIREAARKGIET